MGDDAEGSVNGQPAWLADAMTAIVRVGHGRGFLIEDARGECVVVTAAHCLPRLPRYRPFEDVPYKAILGPLGRRKPTVWAQCLFVDPISDLAVLAEADAQALTSESERFHELTDNRTKLRLGSIAKPSDGWLFGLDRQWEPVTINVDPLNRWRSIEIQNPDATKAKVAANAVAPGTSGSPILDSDGQAVGVISMGQELNPRLMLDLPVWLVERFALDKGAS